MGYGDMQPAGKKQGLGVSTGLAGLDRVLNRDNSELIKAWINQKVLGDLECNINYGS